MPTATVRTYRNGNSESVDLPEGFGFGDGVELRIVRSGNTLTLMPPPRESVPGEFPNAVLVARLRALTMPGDPIEEREPFDDPERPGM